MATLTNEKQLIEFMEKIEQEYLREFQNVVEMIIQEYIDDYYKEYTPVKYERTKQFLKSIVKSDIEKVGNEYICYVYIDVENLHYSAHSGLEVVKMINRGYHADVRMSKKNYNPPKSIESPTDDSYFPTGSLFFWESSMAQTQEELADTLIKCFKKHGVTVRKV